MQSLAESDPCRYRLWASIQFLMRKFGLQNARRFFQWISELLERGIIDFYDAQVLRTHLAVSLLMFQPPIRGTST